MALTFKQIQDMVLEDAFPEAKRTDVKEWIRDAHTEIWDAADYVFKSAVVSATVVNGVMTAPTDLGDIYALYDPSGDPLAPYLDISNFEDSYNSNLSSLGAPESFCWIGTTVRVEPHTAGTASGFQLAYKKTKPTLSADGDPTGLPDGYDMALVYGGKAIGFTLINNPFADDFTARFNAKKEALADAYLYGVEITGEQSPAYRPVIGGW